MGLNEARTGAQTRLERGLKWGREHDVGMGSNASTLARTGVENRGCFDRRKVDPLLQSRMGNNECFSAAIRALSGSERELEGGIRVSVER